MKNKKILLFSLAIILLFSIAVVTAASVKYATGDDNPNIALGKTTIASGVEVEGHNLEGEYATDGNASTRWSSDKSLPGSPVWIYVDLGEVLPIAQVNISWQTANSKDYSIDISSDSKSWETINNFTSSTLASNNYTSQYQLPAIKNARYVRIYANKGNGYNTVSIYEIEIYSKFNVPDVLSKLKNKAPTISGDGTKLVLPASPNDEFNIELFGSSNLQVIDLDGRIHTPLVNTEVALLYKAVHKDDPSVIQKGDFNVTVTVPGRYEIESSDNTVPAVLPALREWKGATGDFVLSDSSRLVIADNNLNETAEMIESYFSDMLGIYIAIASGEPKKSDIYLVLDDSIPELGDEGYYLEVEDILTVSAPAEKGILYGGISITQILYSNRDSLTIPKGIARDYPAYEVRSGMIDVARAWIPLDYIEEITKYFAWFKLNEIHLHINDVGANNYFIFRLESDVEGLTATDGYYTKDAYRAYQKRMLKYGIEVITEIDTPAHSACFSNVTPSVPMLDNYHLDISNPETVEFIKNLFDEYITGDDPVFVSKKVHIGTDEYPIEYSEQMRAYTNALIEHINSRGYTPRFWGAFGNQGFNGVTPVSGDAQANYWATELSDYKTLYDYGYDIVNTCGPILYIVPAGNYGFADYFDLKALYKVWQVNYFTLGGGNKMPDGHPQTIGASFALWNDLHTEYGGFTRFDIFDRLKGAVALMSEKTWCGTQTEDMDVDNFISRFELLSDKAANTNPGRDIEPDGNSVIDTEGAKSIGFPYTADFDVKLDSVSGENIILFDGSDGQLLANINGTGKIGFKREIYTFIYDYEIPAGKTMHIRLSADNKKTVLIIDDTYYYYPVNQADTERNDSSTFVLPLEAISESVSNIAVKYGAVDLNSLRINRNLAYKCKTTVSGLEVNDGRLTDDLAVDGNESTRLSFARDKDEQWLIVDLGEVMDVNKVEILFHEHVPEYKVFISETGSEDSWTEVYYLTDGSEGDRKTDEIEFDTAKARYIKYVQLKRHYVEAFSTYYSGGIFEFRVYGFDPAPYLEKIDTAEAKLNVSDSNEGRAAVNQAIIILNNYLKKENIYQTHLDSITEQLTNAVAYFENPTASNIESITDESKIKFDEFPETLFWIIGGVILIAIAVVALVLIKRRKK
ncbi:MAG: hypothetical protein A2Y17_12780 [Clostridiales bacterium GWF2_38_85]|nr:MAG: hypothetical protein A2Y17_12780 [Clostridiales bacterium GWF2_38_85]HBL84134.1 hypothetical protein [Clostridiales bacterium]